MIFSCVSERATTLEAIAELNKRRFNEDRIMALLRAFYDRGQITLCV